MIKKWITTGLLCLAAHYSYTQTNALATADLVYSQWRFYDAIDLYKKAFSKSKKKEDKQYSIYRIGACYQHILNYEEAERWYKKAILAGAEQQELKLKLAEVFLMNNKPDEAIALYTSNKQEYRNDPAWELLLKKCNYAQHAKDTSRFYVENLRRVNSKSNDMYAVATGKRKDWIYFTSDRESSTGTSLHGGTPFKFPDVFRSKHSKEDGHWSIPQPLNAETDEPVNTNVSEGAVSFNKKENTMYFTRCGYAKNEISGCQIYKAIKQGRNWKEVEMLSLAYDTFVVSQPYIATDESYLLFASNRPGGFGGMDLWMIQKQGENWSEPINLGAEINTSYDDKTPYVNAKGHLIFASTGRVGMGGYDLYIAESTSDLTWANPVNMGIPVNSVRDDFAFSEIEPNRSFYFSSNREGGQGGDDIYVGTKKKVNIELQIEIVDAISKEKLSNSQFEIKDLETGERLEQNLTDGYWELDASVNYLKQGHEYQLIAHAEKHLSAKGMLTIEEGFTSKRYVRTFLLQPIEIEKPMPLPAIYYDVNDASLRPESLDSLDYLLQIMKDNPSIKIKLMAHTDSRGSAKSNKELSQKRAQSCVDYLIEKGISKERMIALGKGEEAPIVTNAEIEKMNLEAEVKAAHQQNRRTEFSILEYN